jgi:transposase-like protein
VDSKRHTRVFWKRLLAEVEGGHPITEVARRHRVRPKTLSWWRWQMARGDKATLALPEFLPVHSTSDNAVAGRGQFEVQVGRVRVRAEAGTDVEYIAALVAALRARC